MFEFEDGLGIEGRGVVQGDSLAVFFGWTAFDGFEAIEHAPARKAAEHKARAELELADELTRNQMVAACGSERVNGVAKLPVLPLVGEL
jgi:hypothetical protein